MANKNIFCNTPWYEAHIYWDGSLGICCQESQKLYSNQETYNIKNMSLIDWFNQDPVKKFRLQMLSESPTEICSRCYQEEQLGANSRRYRANQKSVIFTKTAFEQSFLQSPGYENFLYSLNSSGMAETLPIELHIDLGNYCNLACKMCKSSASTTIASQYVKWGFTEHKKYLGVDWTGDAVVWEKFLYELLTIPNLKNIHFMGGETILAPRFEKFLDFMILHEKFDLSLSFVTNGTRFNPSLIDKLKKFSRVGIEVSIETVTKHNDYIRQGTDTNAVLQIINQYKEYCSNSNVSLVIRPAISALSIGYYDTLLEYCLNHRLLIKSNLVVKPDYLNAKILPFSVRQNYRSKYHKIKEQLDDINSTEDYNESDNNNYRESVKSQTNQILSILDSPEQPRSAELLKSMIQVCKNWDEVYGLDLFHLYPEFREFKN